MSFVELCARSHYSFLDAVPSPNELANAAAQAGMSAACLMDSGNMCGVVEWQSACQDVGIRPLFGVELWTRTHDSTTEEGRPQPGYKLGIIVENETGWRNLCHLVSTAHKQRNYAPRIGIDQLKGYSEGLIGIVKAHNGALEMLEESDAIEQIQRLKEVFGAGSLFVELSDWGLDQDTSRNERARVVATDIGLQTIVCGSPRYIESIDATIFSTLHAISTGHFSGQQDRPGAHPTDQATFRSHDEVQDLFPDDLDAIERTGQIADRCNFTLHLGSVFLPSTEPPDNLQGKARWAWMLDNFPPPKSYTEKERASPSQTDKGWTLADTYLAWYARTGLEKRLLAEPAAMQFASREAYFERLEEELQIMRSMEFSAYHLIVAEFINWAKDNGISVGPGRGSAAGSVVTWAMRITDINPLQFGLMFERYLNPKRVSMPDIDVDFDQRHREEVLRHVREIYGDAQVSQILTIGTMKAKGALKDSARALGVSFNDADRWSKEIDDGPKASLEEALGGPVLSALYEGSPLFRHVATIAAKIEGKPRQTGVHAAGVIITSQPIETFAPVHFEPGDNKSMTGVEMNAAEKLGLVKFDFLGLKTLDIIELALDSIEARTGNRPIPTQPLFDDPAVYELLSSGDSLGLFQVESHGMQGLLRRMEPDRFEDVIALLALYRPGPLQSGMVDQFIECKHGREEVVYPHPLLSQILEPTYGVMVYQEQVMGAAQVLAGYDLGDADLLRRAMGKKKPEEMAKQRSIFVKGCKKNGIEESDSNRIFDLIAKFAGYGFNKSHSAAYAVITYMTAWLKAHYRADLMAAAMTFEASNRDRLIAYVADCSKSGVPVLPPDINRSETHFTVEARSDGDLGIRFGLGAIKGLGESSLPQIFAQRPYISFEQFVQSSGANKSVGSALAGAGAFDGLNLDRFEAWWQFNKPKPKTSRMEKKYGTTQIHMFTQLTVGEMLEHEAQQVEEEARPRRWNYTERLDREKSALGCWLTGHPLDRFASMEVRAAGITVRDLGTLKKNQPATLVGVITKVHKIETRRRQAMGYFTLSDRTGITEVALSPEVWHRHNALCKREAVVVVRGRLDRDGEEGQFRVDLDQGVVSLSQMRLNAATGLHLSLYEEDTTAEVLADIRKCLALYEAPRDTPGCKLRIHVRSGRHTAVLLLKKDPLFTPRADMFDELEALTGRPEALSLHPPRWEALDPQGMSRPARSPACHNSTPTSSPRSASASA